MRTILIVTAAWVGFDVLFVLFMFWKSKRQQGICYKCRYAVYYSEQGACSVLGIPLGCVECKYYESWRREA